MPSGLTGLFRARFALGCALLAGVAALAASCAEAIDATEYTDAFAATCELAAQCYGDAFTACGDKLVLLQSEGYADAWLREVERRGCLGGCSSLYRCFDFPPICKAPKVGADEAIVLAACGISDDCCGFSTGAAICEGGACCRPLGAECSAGAECCPSAGDCDLTTGTCGGVVCAAAGADCLNDFQCCTGRCGDAGVCEDTPCPPEGYTCVTDADCCALVCDPATKRCTDPEECSLLAQPCVTAQDCCNKTHVCYHDPASPPGSGGICSTADCNPVNSDCFTDDQCCTGYCAPDPYRLCGNCQKNVGDPCSAAVPCCNDLFCDEEGACAPKTKTP